MTHHRSIDHNLICALVLFFLLIVNLTLSAPSPRQTTVTDLQGGPKVAINIEKGEWGGVGGCVIKIF